MLFDLRTGKRRRVIQVVYASLALLMGGGLVFFGIGGDAPGGIGDALGLTDQGRGGSGSDALDDEIEDLEARVEANPRDQAALLELVTAHAQAASAQIETDEETGQPVLTEEAVQEFEESADAWDQYLRLKPKKPDSGAAATAAQTFVSLAQSSQSALEAQSNMAEAARAQRIVATERPTEYADLAVYLYFAGDFAGGDEAAKQAASAASAGNRDSISRQLAQFEKQAQMFQKQVTVEKKAAKAGAGVEGGENPLQEVAPLGGGL